MTAAAELSLPLLRCRLAFRALSAVRFPPLAAGNVLRGALGFALKAFERSTYGLLYRARWEDGPSGLHDPPRPFVLRAAHLNGQQFLPGQRFHLDVHLFVADPALLPPLERAFAAAAATGFGELHGRAELCTVEARRVTLSLEPAPSPAPATAVQVRFLTPTDLRGVAPAAPPPFGLLFARLRDRLSTLRALYAGGPLAIDFRAAGERAALVRLAGGAVRQVEVGRHSARTGQEHPLGGFVGEARYEGALGEFLPYLAAGAWTGVGRHTVWGNGLIAAEVAPQAAAAG